MLQTHIAYIRIDSKWWTYVSAEIYYSKQSSIFFLLICIHKTVRQKLSFLRIFWQSNCPNIWWFCRGFKIVSDSIFKYLLHPNFPYILWSNQKHVKTQFYTRQITIMSCLLMSSIHFPRQNTCLCSNSPSPFAGRGFKKNKLMYIHIFKQSALLLEKLQEKQSPYCCFTLRAIHWEKQPKIKKKQCRSWKKKQTNVSLINITGRINCCMKCSISTTALWDQYKLSLLNVVKKKKKLSRHFKEQFILFYFHHRL